jgi:short-subunit dehydrogenase
MGEGRGLAVVTGASSGIGAVYAERLAARGHSLLLVARRPERLASTKDRLSSNYKVEVATLVASEQPELFTEEVRARDLQSNRPQ